MGPVTEPAEGLPPRLRGASGAAYRGFLAGSLVALAYLVVLGGYLTAGETDVIDPLRAAYPLVWLSLSAAAIAGATAGAGRATVRPWPAAIGGGYVLLLAWISGQLTFAPTGFGVEASAGLPGWAPVVIADLGVATAVVVPFQSLGYVVLGALLARALSVTGGSLLAGVLGLFTCAGCVLPVIAAVAAAGSVPVISGGLSYAVSTAAFALTLGVLTAVVVRGGPTTACPRE
ncbi:hypothetical protein GRS48_11485 [Halorubrum sp. JWXQ-INN 858]|uniref:DUF7546 family protein n=1 Tax=Halorubrum sp. JWXQ-INN 858 TaxID=2690782 RepID=UPI00135CC236|nr:hypothetical protein [Halorubrum sp. JWXQ-INN 858]MWV65434.1 hypothetical protein [Halorubrum sp. JWXQ-INN 858]